jgi:hypothetical protein
LDDFELFFSCLWNPKFNIRAWDKKSIGIDRSLAVGVYASVLLRSNVKWIAMEVVQTAM